MTEYNPQEVYAKGNSVLLRTYAYLNDAKEFCIDENYYKWLERRNTELVADKIESYTNIGKWLSAALEDPLTCEEFKKDIRDWFDSFNIIERNTGKPIDEVVK
jgi:transposase-like protein